MVTGRSPSPLKWALVLFASTLLTRGTIQGQIAANHGWSASVVRSGATANSALRAYEIELRRTDRPAESRTVTVQSTATSIEQLEIPNPRTLVVIGRAEGEVSTLAIIDIESTFVVVDALCHELRLDPKGDRYVFRDARTNELRFAPLTRGSTRGAMSSSEGTIKLLLSPRAQDRLRALDALTKYSSVASQPGVRVALVEALKKAVEADAAAAAAEAGTTPEGIRRYSADRQVLNKLLNVIAVIGPIGALPTVVVADDLAVAGAIAAYGPSAIPHVEEAMTRPVPNGYSPYYKVTLLQGLMLVTSRYRLTEADRDRVVKLTVATLDKPGSWRTLNAAILLAHELDDDTLEEKIDACAHPAQLRLLGVEDPQGMTTIQETVHRIQSRRILIR